jgi:putative oxidoreductase
MDLGLLILRLVVGSVYAAHGGSKLFGWFGGGGLAVVGGSFENLGFRPGKLHAFLAGAAELGGGALLTLGLFTPAAAAVLIGVMLVAGVSVHSKAFFLQKGGFEYALVLATPPLVLAFTGPGAISLDQAAGLATSGAGWGFAALAVGIAGGLASLASRKPVAQPATPAAH